MLTRVMSKAAKRFGKVYPATPTKYMVEFKFPIKGGYKFVGLFEDNKDNPFSPNVGRAFCVGDVAEYDSYNLRYTGTITKITDKAITIVAYPGTTMAKTHRLDLNTFAWRNFNFNAAKVAAENADTMMYI